MEDKEEQKHVLVCMVDGSTAAQSAFDLALLITRRSKASNFFQVIHVYNPQSKHAQKYMPDYIRQHYTNCLLTQFPSSKYAVKVVEMKDNPKKDSFKLAQQDKAQIIFMGFRGRKGDGGKDSTLMGSAVSSASQFVEIPFMVYKSKIQDPESLVYGACVDGSKKCLQALHFLARFLSPKDKLILIYALHTSHENKSAEIKQECKQMIGEHGFEMEVLVGCHDVRDSLIEFINVDEKYVFDVIVFGNNGHRAQEKQMKGFLGSTAQYLLLKADANLLFYPG